MSASRLDRLALALKKNVLLVDARRARVHGIPVYAILEHDSLLPLCFAKLRRALDFLAERDPRRYRRLHRDVKRVLVSRYEGSHFLPPLRMIVLYWPNAAMDTPEEIALSLVHEATHARLHARGIAYLPELRARIEAACLAQEMAFARRIPGGSALVDPHALERPWWTTEAYGRRWLRELRDLGTPRWLYRLAERRYQRRIARDRQRTAGRQPHVGA